MKVPDVFLLDSQKCETSDMLLYKSLESFSVGKIRSYYTTDTSIYIYINWYHCNWGGNSHKPILTLQVDDSNIQPINR